MATKQAPFLIVDTAEAFGDGQRWVIGRSAEGEIRVAYRSDEMDAPVFVDLGVSEAHDLGTALRRMAKKVEEQS